MVNNIEIRIPLSYLAPMGNFAGHCCFCISNGDTWITNIVRIRSTTPCKSEFQ